MSQQKRDGEFWECAECREKPGSPTLCASCLHSRAVVTRLKADLANERMPLSKHLQARFERLIARSTR